MTGPPGRGFGRNVVAHRRPPLVRAARWVFALGTIALLLLVVYIGAAVYYAREIATPGTHSTNAGVVGGDALRVTTSFNLSNPGPFSITGLTIVGFLDYPNGTFWLEGGTPSTNLSGGSVSSVNIRFELPLGSLAGTSGLLVNDSALPLQYWVNATYASLVSIALASSTTYHWGAPFYGLNVSFGTPTLAPNGTLGLPLTVAFANHAPVHLVGTAVLTLRSSDGSFCTDASFPVDAPNGAAYRDQQTVYLPSGCHLSGGSYSGTWTGSGLSLAVPGGRIP